MSGLLAEELAWLEREASRQDLPANLRARVRQILNWTREVREAIESNDEIGRQDLLARGATYAAYLQDVTVFTALLDSGAIEPDQDARTLTLHWDRVPSEQRQAAISLSNELVDAYRGRSAGGRPKKTSRKTG